MMHDDDENFYFWKTACQNVVTMVTTNFMDKDLLYQIVPDKC